MPRRGKDYFLSGKTTCQGVAALRTSEIEHAIIVEFGRLAVRTEISSLGSCFSLDGRINLEFRILVLQAETHLKS
jgi:hypothetical protein